MKKTMKWTKMFVNKSTKVIMGEKKKVFKRKKSFHILKRRRFLDKFVF